MVAAVLKCGKYRSAANYLSQYRADSEREGYHLECPIRIRGLGPGERAWRFLCTASTCFRKGHDHGIREARFTHGTH